MTNNEYYKKLTEMKVRFNELSQKLNNDYGLCSQVANLIDLTAETRELTERLSCVDSKIPSINLKIQALISGCNNNLSQYYENTLSNIITTFTQSGRVLPDVMDSWQKFKKQFLVVLKIMKYIKQVIMQ